MVKRTNTGLLAWQQFVIDHGWQANGYQLAHILGVGFPQIRAFRALGVGRRLAKPMAFAEIFALWHGREPIAADWPAPRREGVSGYQWLAPEDALLASLVGTMGAAEIARVLTERLRKLTRDSAAARTQVAVQNRIQIIGLQAGDVVGGIPVSEAGREIGSVNIVRQAIASKRLRARKAGRFLVIGRDSWVAFKASRAQAPPGFVQLASLRVPLGFSGDKLAEYATLGYVPTAVRVHPRSPGIKNTGRGTWFVAPEIATQLLADRRAGRAMPWHGKPTASNLKQTWKRLEARRHPPECATCKQIWGRAGAPREWDDYVRRYPPLEHGEKRHLTRPWTPGLTIAEVATACAVSVRHVTLAIEAGILPCHTYDRRRYVTRSEATRWKARRCPAGDRQASWMSLSTAQTDYGFGIRELQRLIREGALKSKVVTVGPARGQKFVSKHQCRVLRERLGYPLEEAARRAGITPQRFTDLLEGAGWRRKGEGIPLALLQTIIKRVQSCHGYSLEESAKLLRKPLAWVLDRRDDGTIRVQRSRADARRLYITEPMFERLKRAAKTSQVRITDLGPGWVNLSAAALDAGVSNATVLAWVKEGLQRRSTSQGYRYRLSALRRRAKRYWESECRFHRRLRPAWLQQGTSSAQPRL